MLLTCHPQNLDFKNCNALEAQGMITSDPRKNLDLAKFKSLKNLYVYIPQ